MNKKSKIALFSFIPMVIFCIGIRTIQYANAVDLNTGFFKNNAGFFKYVLAILLGLAFVLFLSLSLLDKGRGSKAFSIKGEQVSQPLLKAFAFSLIVSAAMIVIKIPEVISEGRKHYLLLFAMLVGVVFLAISGFYIVAKRKFDRFTALFFAGVSVYIVIRSGMLFLSRMVVASNPQYVLEILSRLSLVFFIYSFARVMIGAEKKFTRITAIVMGLFSSLIIFTTEIGSFITLFIVDVSYLDVIKPSPENLFMGVFALLGVVLLYCGKVKKSPATELPDDLPDVGSKASLSNNLEIKEVTVNVPDEVE